MRWYLYLVSLLALTGCAVPTSPQNSGPILPDGTWEGKLDWIVRPDGMRGEGGQGIAVTACAGQVRIWLMTEDGNYRGPRRDFRVRSSLRSHAIQFIDAADDQPGWVEIQTYTLLEKADDSAAIQWTRAVNNLALDDNDANRTILEYGVGTLRRTRKECSNPPLAPL